MVAQGSEPLKSISSSNGVVFPASNDEQENETMPSEVEKLKGKNHWISAWAAPVSMVFLVALGSL